VILIAASCTASVLEFRTEELTNITEIRRVKGKNS
jgi:hypothetical protein